MIWQESRDVGSTSRQFIEHGLFVVSGRVQAVGPVGVDLDMAGGAGAGAAAQAADVETHARG